jgi:hypothetical protein
MSSGVGKKKYAAPVGYVVIVNDETWIWGNIHMALRTRAA